MAKVYQCDACGDVMNDPYTVKMKEFYAVHPSPMTRTKKIHLCDNCYKGLKKLAEQVSDN